MATINKSNSTAKAVWVEAYLLGTSVLIVSIDYVECKYFNIYALISHIESKFAWCLKWSKDSQDISKIVKRYPYSNLIYYVKVIPVFFI